MNLPQQSIEQILGSSAVNREFGEKIKELDRRLKMNGMSYLGYESMTDRQQEILTQGLFLEPESAIGLDEYVKTAVDNCGCEDVKEDLHHHSPVLMREIETEKEKLPDLKIKIGESLGGLDQTIDLLLEQILQEQEQEQDPELLAKKALASLEVYIIRNIFKQKTMNDGPEAKAKTQGSPKSTRGGRHVRGEVDGDLEAVGAFYKKHGLKLGDWDGYKISGSYPALQLTATKDIEFELPARGGKTVKYLVPKGTVTPYINATAASTGKTFKTKELSPDGFGLAGKTFNSKQDLIKATAASVDERYGDRPEIAIPLKAILKDAEIAKGAMIDLSDALVFGTSDLATISKDYGEILAAIWSFDNLDFERVEFPVASNHKLIDFYGLRKAKSGKGFDETPVSVKSGPTGGKVNIKNIVDALERQNLEVDLNAQYAKDVFETAGLEMKDQMVRLHQLMSNGKGTKIIQNLSKITKIPVGTKKDGLKNDYSDGMNQNNLTAWAEEAFKNGTLVDLIDKKWYSTLTIGRLTKDDVRKRVFVSGQDPVRSIISPLGENIKLMLNDDPKMKASLTSLARQVILLQTKVDVKKAKMTFRTDKFSEAEFKFGWGGYSAGNKLGFAMDFKK